MTVYEAIHQMRQLTAEGRPFALSYMTYSRQKHQSHGEVACEHALLVKNPRPESADGFCPSASPASSPAAPTSADGFCPSDYMLTYRDQDTGEARHFYQPLLLSFNHTPLTSID